MNTGDWSSYETKEQMLYVAETSLCVSSPLLLYLCLAHALQLIFIVDVLPQGEKNGNRLLVFFGKLKLCLILCF